MKKATRLLSLILVVVMLAAIAVSCSNVKDDDPGSSNGTTTVSPNPEGPTGGDETTPGETSSTRITPDVPDGTNFGGHIFRVLTRGTYSETWYSRDIYSAGISGDTIADAVYARNTAMEEKYGFRVEEVGSQNPQDEAKIKVQSGVDEYDMFCFRIKDHITSLILQGYLKNLNNVEMMNLDQPYYDQNSREAFSMAKRLYLVTGDLLTMDNDATRCTLFNKTLFNQLSIADHVGGNLYEHMANGTWTLDVMQQCATIATYDLDGDGEMSMTDRWGMVSEQFNALAFFNSAGSSLFEKNADDVPVFIGNSERSLTILGDVVTMLNGPYCRHYSNAYNEAIPQFKDGLVLFYPAQLADVPLLRSMAFDFGIVPLPKYTAEQESYVSPVTTHGSNCIAIPISVKDVDRAATIIEVLSCESMYVLTPAYYEVNLKSKLAVDEESSASIDVIMDTAMFELAYMWNIGGLYNAICFAFKNNSPSLASSFKQAERICEKTIQKNIATIEGFKD